MNYKKPIYQIAKEIAKDWEKPYFGAIPYLEAMHHLSDINDKFGMDNCKNIILYFLSNASTWRGPKAKEIKSELRNLIK